jgi:hypothetical protein
MMLFDHLIWESSFSQGPIYRVRLSLACGQ